MRYFIYLSYDGTAYHGWQIQPNGISVQERLNRALSALVGQPVACVGAGRTDAGVHAACMVAHFDAEPRTGPRGERFEDWIAARLDRMLPPDIAVHCLRAVRSDAHARFDATARTYHYSVVTAKCPFARHYAMRLLTPHDFEAMNRAAARLLDVSDFTSFAKLHTDAKTNRCRVSLARWVQTEPQGWRFEITADRFLRNMVRAIVGTLLEVGRGRLDLEGFERIIAQRDRCAAGDSVSANALSLVDIAYPDDLFLDHTAATP